MDAFQCQDNVGFLTPQLEEILKILMNENDRIMYECQTRERNIREGREEGLKQGREEGLKQGREEGLERGLEQGMKVARMEIARTLLASGMTREDVAQITGLDVSDLD